VLPLLFRGTIAREVRENRIPAPRAGESAAQPADQTAVAS